MDSGPHEPEQYAGLLQRCSRADEASFAALYDGTAARVFGLVLRVVRDRSQAEEVTQAAFVEAWHTSARFKPHEGSAVSWLLSIAHRRAVERVRSDESSSSQEASHALRGKDPEHTVAFETAHASLQAQPVRDALDLLPDAERETLELAYFSGYTYPEVAQILDLPHDTVRARIREALIRLHDIAGVPR